MTDENIIIGKQDTPENEIIFNDESGNPILIIDTDKRTITTPDDVDVNKTAQLVLDALKQLMWSYHGEKETIR